METIEIIEYTEKYKAFFKKLNYEWIEKFFVIEPTDEYVLNHPEEVVINPGGYIYFAKLNDEIVGTFALMKIDETTYEFAKMAVSTDYQNRGIGKMLLTVAIQKARELGIDRLVLYTNTSLAAAVSLYHRVGFRMIPKTDFHNNRANIKMEKVLRKDLMETDCQLFCNIMNVRKGDFDLN